MLRVRKPIKKTNRYSPLRKKMNDLKKTNKEKKIYVWIEDVSKKNDRDLNVITLFPEDLNLQEISSK